MRMKNSRAEQLRTYFILVEEMYRDHMTGAIGKRLAVEDESVAHMKANEKTRPRANFPKGDGVYVIEIMHRGQATYKVGSTDNVQRRFQELLSIYPGTLKVVYWQPGCESEYIELCSQTLFKNHEVEHEVFATDVDEIIKSLEICRRHYTQMKAELAEQSTAVQQ
jgi:hypothetical protein